MTRFEGNGRPLGVYTPRGKSELHSEGCPLTAGRGDPTESATETNRCKAVRVKR